MKRVREYSAALAAFGVIVGLSALQIIQPAAQCVQLVSRTLVERPFGVIGAG